MNVPIGTVGRFVPATHDMRLVDGQIFGWGGVCTCDHWDSRWRRSQGWVVRDWRTHLKELASPPKEFVPTDSQGDSQERLDEKLRRGIITPLEHFVFSWEVFSAMTTHRDASRRAS